MTHTDDPAADIADFNRVMAGELDDYLMDERWIRKDGRVIVATISVKCPGRGDGSADDFVAPLRDVTVRKQAEDAPRRSEALLAEAQHLAHVGSWSWDIRTGGLDWSDELYRVFGLDPGQQPPSHERFLAGLHPADRDRVSELIDAACRGTRAYDCEFRIVRPDAEIRVVHTRGRVIRNGAGEAVEMIGMAQDITDRRRAEEQIRHQVHGRTWRRGVVLHLCSATEVPEWSRPGGRRGNLI